MKIKVEIELIGWFPDIYEFNKPKGMSDRDYVNAIVSSWLVERDMIKTCPKPRGKNETNSN